MRIIILFLIMAILLPIASATDPVYTVTFTPTDVWGGRATNTSAWPTAASSHTWDSTSTWFMVDSSLNYKEGSLCSGCGYTIASAAAAFDTSSIPSNATITQVRFIIRSLGSGHGGVSFGVGWYTGYEFDYSAYTVAESSAYYGSINITGGATNYLTLISPDTNVAKGSGAYTVLRMALGLAGGNYFSEYDTLRLEVTYSAPVPTTHPRLIVVNQ